MPKATLLLADISRKLPTFQVSRDGTVLGTIKHRWFRHIQMAGWEATGTDGHRGVHEHRWQAAEALAWDGTGYPFPIVHHHHDIQG